MSIQIRRIAVANRVIPAGGLIGTAVAMIGAIIKLLVYYNTRIESGSIICAPGCLLLPISGGLLGLGGATVAHRIWESRISIFVGGFLGGLLPTLFSYPYFDLGWLGQY